MVTKARTRGESRAAATVRSRRQGSPVERKPGERGVSLCMTCLREVAWHDEESHWVATDPDGGTHKCEVRGE